MTLPVPRGWDFSQLSPSEWQWRPPGQPSFGHVMRVEQVLEQPSLDRLDPGPAHRRALRGREQRQDPGPGRRPAARHLRHQQPPPQRLLHLARPHRLRQRPGRDRRDRPRPGRGRDGRPHRPGRHRDPAGRDLTGLRCPGSSPRRAPRLAVPRWSARTCTHSSWLELTWTTRSTITSAPGQPLKKTVIDSSPSRFWSRIRPPGASVHSSCWGTREGSLSAARMPTKTPGAGLSSEFQPARVPAASDGWDVLALDRGPLLGVDLRGPRLRHRHRDRPGAVGDLARGGAGALERPAGPGAHAEGEQGRGDRDRAATAPPPGRGRGRARVDVAGRRAARAPPGWGRARPGPRCAARPRRARPSRPPARR